MSEGYVYILYNPSFDGVVKIGWTSRSSEERAREISSGTGVPTPYIVLAEERVLDCQAVEERLHRHFASQRINPAREFFRVAIKDAVRALHSIAREFQPQLPGTPSQPAEAVEISTELRRRYGAYVRPDIVSVRMLQSSGTCFLEVTSKAAPDALDEHVERTDLSFILEGDPTVPMFSPTRSLVDNATRFLSELDPYSIIMCTNLFTERAATEIAQTYEHGAA